LAAALSASLVGSTVTSSDLAVVGGDPGNHRSSAPVGSARGDPSSLPELRLGGFDRGRNDRQLIHLRRLLPRFGLVRISGARCERRLGPFSRLRR
jgi:hypothetical protein